MEINIAFALSKNGSFEKKHFGDADKYQIYRLSNEVFNLLFDEENPFKNMDETPKHGAKKKADSIIKFLSQKEVSVVVSRKFGRNIKHIHNHFIPVQVHEETPEKVKTILLKHMRWLQEELEKQPEQYKLFDINSGILKIAIQKRFK
ncbi:MAG: NifB/NifX family molybdenum-iron cluster-binding protein [Bacteroidota bacterium]